MYYIKGIARGERICNRSRLSRSRQNSTKLYCRWHSCSPNQISFGLMRKRLLLILPIYKSQNEINVSSSDWSIRLLKQIAIEPSIYSVHVLAPQLFGLRSIPKPQQTHQQVLVDFDAYKKVSLITCFTTKLPVLKTLFNIVNSVIAVMYIRVRFPKDCFAVLTYNTYASTFAGPSFLKWIGFSFKLCPIILDLDNPSKDHWRDFKRQTKNCDRIIFISPWAYQNYNGPKSTYNFIGVVHEA